MIKQYRLVVFVTCDCFYLIWRPFWFYKIYSNLYSVIFIHACIPLFVNHHKDLLLIPALFQKNVSTKTCSHYSIQVISYPISIYKLVPGYYLLHIPITINKISSQRHGQNDSNFTSRVVIRKILVVLQSLVCGTSRRRANHFGPFLVKTL